VFGDRTSSVALAFGLLTRAGWRPPMDKERNPRTENEDLDQSIDERIKDASDEEEFEDFDETDEEDEDLEA
jgi:hypothetical protein